MGIRPLRIHDDDSSRQDFEDSCMTLLEDRQPQSLIGMRICAGQEMALLRRGAIAPDYCQKARLTSDTFPHGKSAAFI